MNVNQNILYAKLASIDRAWFSWLIPPELTSTEAIQRFSESFYAALWAGLLSSLITGILLGIFVWKFTTKLTERQAQRGSYSRLFYSLASSDGRTWYKEYTTNDIYDAVRLMVHYVDIINSISFEGYDKQTKEFESILNMFRESYIRFIENPLTKRVPGQETFTIIQIQEIKPYVDDINLNFKRLYQILDMGIRRV